MQRNQFFYTETVTIPASPGDPKNGIEPTLERTLDKRSSFNTELVLRSITYDDGRVLVLLNDLHERWQDRPTVNKNGRKRIDREKDTFQSEITLSLKDGERFFKLTNIEE